MAWIPSHQELRDHPKTRRAARKAGVSLPTLVGHLHLLWHWALDHAPHGDLSKYDAEDLADAAMWDGDPETFIKALVDCGPGESNGFIDGQWRLHDWHEYGGAYARRVAAARKAAAVRWQSERNADASDEQANQDDSYDRNANASADAEQPQTNGNAEDRTGQDRRTPTSPPSGARGSRLPDGWKPKQERKLQAEAKTAGVDVIVEFEKFCDYWRAKPGKDGRKVDWQATWRNWLRRAIDDRGRRAPPAERRSEDHTPGAF